MSSKHLSSQTGFSLVELMVVVAVAALLLGMALPSFADMIDRARLKTAAGDAVALVVDARGFSVQRNRNVVVSFAGTTPAWGIGAKRQADPATLGDALLAAAPCDCGSAPSLCTVGLAAAPAMVLNSSSYTGVTTDTNSASLTFDSRLGTVKNLTSTLTTSGATFTSPSGKYQLTLFVAPLGQARLCVPAGKPIIPGYVSC